MLQQPPRRIPPILAGALIAALLAACSSGSQTGTGAPGGANIAFAAPTDGATVSVPFDVQIDASVPLGAPDTGNQHAHIYFDSSTDSADYDIVYGTTAQVTRDLGPGEHTLIVALANPDHSLAGPTQQITVTVGEGGGAPAGTTPTIPPLGY